MHYSDATKIAAIKMLQDHSYNDVAQKYNCSVSVLSVWRTNKKLKALAASPSASTGATTGKKRGRPAIKHKTAASINRITHTPTETMHTKTPDISTCTEFSDSMLKAISNAIEARCFISARKLIDILEDQSASGGQQQQTNGEDTNVETSAEA